MDLAAQFGQHPIPVLLQELFLLQEAQNRTTLAEGFYIWERGTAFTEDLALGKKRNQYFIEFATANGTGSAYAIWITGTDLEQCPIAVFGDEVGFHIIARNSTELLRLLTFDTEIMVTWEDTFFYKDADSLNQSSSHHNLLKWAKDKLDSDPIITNEQAEAIVKNAQAKHQT